MTSMVLQFNRGTITAVNVLLLLCNFYYYGGMVVLLY